MLPEGAQTSCDRITIEISVERGITDQDLLGIAGTDNDSRLTSVRDLPCRQPDFRRLCHTVQTIIGIVELLRLLGKSK